MLLRNSLCIATRAIRKQDNFADIKPAIQVLEHFLNIGLIDAAKIAQINQPEDLGLSWKESIKTDHQNSDIQQEQLSQSLQRFAFSVLEWMQYPDCAPAVGRFLLVYFKSLGEIHSDDAFHTSKDGAMPMWIFPVKQALERHQELLEVFEIHVLPGLLRLGPNDVKAFLQILPFESIQRGYVGVSSTSDIQLCILVAKTAAEGSSLREHIGQEQSTLLDTENLAISLLEHASSSVRVAALSLVIFSSASTRPFSQRVLCRIRQCIPCFHVEVNAKPRNEFIALMKKLCVRLQGATLVLLRHCQDQGASTRGQASTAAQSVATYNGKGEASSENIIEQALDESKYILEEHIAFRKWYMVFLLEELRPTSSYQSHITALRILEYLLERIIALRNTSSKSCDDYFGALSENLPRRLFLRPLTELLLDPFDDVRHFANRVFDLHHSTCRIPPIGAERDDKAGSVDQGPKDQLENDDDRGKANHSILADLNKAEDRARTTGRADHADGLGRLYNLLFTSSGTLNKSPEWYQTHYLIMDHVISSLEKEIDIARNDLLLAVGNIPLHGHLIALR